MNLGPRVAGVLYLLLGLILVYIGYAGPLTDAQQGAPVLSIGITTMMAPAVVLFGVTLLFCPLPIAEAINTRQGNVYNISAALLISLITISMYFVFKGHLEGMGYSFHKAGGGRNAPMVGTYDAKRDSRLWKQH